MKHEHKFSQEQQHDAAHETRQQAGQEFASAEEMLRFDAAHTAVPPQIADRLKHSIGSAPPAPGRSWWKNLFGQ
jgi:hypothetical protein